LYAISDFLFTSKNIMAYTYSITGPSSLNEGETKQFRVNVTDDQPPVDYSDPSVSFWNSVLSDGRFTREQVISNMGIDWVNKNIRAPYDRSYTISGIDPARTSFPLSGNLYTDGSFTFGVNDNYKFDGPTTAKINIGNGAYTFDVLINDISTTIPVLSAQSTSYDEGSNAVFTLKNAKPSSSYSYQVVRSATIDDNDIKYADLIKTIQTDSKGEAVISVGILNDLRTEGPETLSIAISLGLLDPLISPTELLKISASTIINDTSKTSTSTVNPTPPAVPQPTLPVKTLPIKLQGPSASINEGSTFVIYIDASQVVSTDPVYVVPYTLSGAGISAEDISRVFIMGAGSPDQLTNPLSGEVGIGMTFGLRGTGVVSFLARSDYLTEGPETLIFSAGGQSVSIVINDTSIGSPVTPTAPTQPVITQPTQPVSPVISTPTFTTSNSISVPTGSLAVSSTAANDLITGTTATNIVDTVAYKGSIKDYKVAIGSNGNYTVVDAVSSRDGSDVVANVERLKFLPDTTTGANRIALDLSPAQASGKAALLIGAVLPGKLALDPEKYQLMGTVIDLFDQGFSLQALSGALLRLPIWGILTGKSNPTNADIATYLVNNVYGVTSQIANLGADLARSLAIDAMNAETPATQGTYLATLALSTASQTHIDLVGVQATGLVYLS